mgnify:FL=1
MRLSDIIKHLKGIFESKKKNPVNLANDSNLEPGLKPLMVNDKNTPLQISEDTIDVKGSLKVNGVDVSTEPDDTGSGATQLNELTDVAYSSGDLIIQSLDKIVAGGSLELESGGVLTFNNNSTTRIAFENSGSAVARFEAGQVFLKEEGSASSDSAAFGQIWIKDDTPNNLYFTDDSGQDIAITNNGVIANQKFFLTSAFFHGSDNAEFIPLAGGSTFEQASLIDFTIDDTNFIVPYNLKINTIYANVVKASSGTANPGNTSLKLYKDGSAYSGAVTVNLSSVGFDTTNIHSVYTWDFSGETNTYSAGEVMQIEIDPTSTLQYVSITIVGQYT